VNAEESEQTRERRGFFESFERTEARRWRNAVGEQRPGKSVSLGEEGRGGGGRRRRRMLAMAGRASRDG
jgi:hypothetical protein